MTRRTAALVDTLLRQLASFDAERQRWEAERSILLTRIQDPSAAVAMTMATLPPPGEHDMDIR